MKTSEEPSSGKGMSLHVVIDTSIYRKDPRREKAAFRALERLAKGKKLQLHISDVTRSEFLTQQATQLTGRFREIESGASSVLRSNTDEELRAFAKDISVQLQNFLLRCDEIVQQEFSLWTTALAAEVHPVADGHGRRVMDAYFGGEKPFRTAKNREDIPDSFIWESVIDLLERHERIHFVSSDSQLLDAAQKQQGIELYGSLDDFIQSDRCQKALQELDADDLRNNIDRALAALSQNEAFVRETVELHLVSSLDGKEVRSRNIPDDNNEATVISVNEPERLELSFDDVDYYGGAELGLPFSAAVLCTVNYAIFKSDYHCLSDGKAERISIDERNDHYYDADEDYTVEVKGTLSISLGKGTLENDLGPDELNELIVSADYKLELDEIEVEGGEEF